MAREKKTSLPAPSAVTASGSTLRIESYQDSVQVGLQRQQWQQRALNYYASEGHVHYAATYVGNAMARVRLVAAKRDLNKPERAPIEVKTGSVAKAVARLSSPRAGQRGLMRNLGRNVFLTGECWVIGTTTPIGDQLWEALSIDEITVISGSDGIYRRRLPGLTPDKLPENALTLRIWQESPRYSQLADAAMQSVLDLVEKILLLNRAEKAAARSRFAGAGILAIPTELIPPARQQQDKSANPVEGNPIASQLTESMMAPLSDEGHPSSVVPVMIFGPAEAISKINYISLDRPIDKSIRASIDDAIKQIAHGLDLPQEILLGTGTANHWSAAAITTDVFQNHLQPLIELICDALTTAYLRPALQRAGVVEKDDEEYIVWYDPTQLMIRPDKGDKALALYDRGLLSGDAVRHETGFADTDAPTDAEYKKWVGIKLADASLATGGAPTPLPASPAEQVQARKDMATHSNELAKNLATHTAALAPESGVGTTPKGKALQSQPLSSGRGPGRPTETTRAGSRRSTPHGSGRPLESRADRRVTSAGTAATGPAVTASAAETGPGPRLSYTMAAIDELLIESMLEYSSSVAATVIPELRSLTAAADATDAVAAAFSAEEAATFFFDAYDLVFSGMADALEYAQLVPMFLAEDAAQAVSGAVKFGVESWRAAITARINDLVYGNARPMALGESVEGPIRPGDLRGAITVAAGGSVSSHIGIANTPSGSFTSGKIVLDALLANGIPVDGFLWHYSIGATRRGFDGHKQLSGLVYQQPDDPELAILPQDAWLRREYYAIGDHFGCNCLSVPWVGPNWGPGKLVPIQVS